jgi:hypothetical protein
MEFHFISELRWNSVILPMVLQIHKTMVLQRVELDGKARSSPFEVFGLVEALMGKHGFAEKIQK